MTTSKVLLGWGGRSRALEQPQQPDGDPKGGVYTMFDNEVLIAVSTPSPNMPHAPTPLPG